MSFNPDFEKIDWTLLAKYFSGNTTEAENKLIKEWAESSPKNRTILKTTREAWEASKTTRQVWDTDAAWARLSKETQKQPKTSPSTVVKPLHKSKPASWKQFLKVAAVLLIAASIGILSYQNEAPETSEAIEQPPVVKEFTNHKGQRSTLQLPDNSKVFLAADSRLILQPHFNEKERRVFIEGKAYFEIAKDANRPFIVETDYGRIEVLGTKFNVDAFPESDQQEVAVAEGRVAFSTNENIQQPAILTAGKLGILPFNGDKITVQDIENIDFYRGWTQDRLIFKDTPLTSVITRLERWYGIECEIKSDEIASKKLTSTFENQQLNEVLDAIALSLDIEHTKTENTHVFSKK
ncbi:MAG: DUF4974 domain-containing protein [Balneolaceae bacterium]|nr:DUF4974 domain-containing protein [Balneolaceae bacterium]